MVAGAVLGSFSHPTLFILTDPLLQGLILSHLIKFSHNRGFTNRESYVAQYISLAIFVTGVVSTLGSDDLLAAFAAGLYIAYSITELISTFG